MEINNYISQSRASLKATLVVLILIISQTHSQQSECSCDQILIGDGTCDQDCNIEACGYDFGDCGLTEGSSGDEVKSDKELFKEQLQYFVQFQFDKDLDENKRKAPGNTVVAFASIGFCI